MSMLAAHNEANGATELPDAPVLAASHVSKTYHMGDVEVHALNNATLALGRSELVVLLGPSGSGKSTLLNILGGLDVPSSGTLTYLGQTLSGADDETLTKYRRDHVGFVFQFYNLIPSLTARENIALVTDISRDPMSADEALAMVGLTGRKDRFPAQLSGGEQQRVAIARAIAKRPSILLCDEPTGALDYDTGKLVLQVIEQVNRETGTTTAIITHNAPIAFLGDRTIRMRSGEIVEETRNDKRLPVSDIKW